LRTEFKVCSKVGVATAVFDASRLGLDPGCADFLMSSGKPACTEGTALQIDAIARYFLSVWASQDSGLV
jgi:hypothetical protein